ncbi:MAG: alpha/beta fold hydrolase [Alphaproteobacteria bacterium]|nr:alpha/beta fold hydrolase [Alphaproteobacteria bacterium]
MVAEVAFAPFQPRWPWIGADSQTIRDAIMRPAVALPTISTERLDVPMSDGTGDTLVGFLDRPRQTRSGRPLAILIHGLTGCSDSIYTRRTTARLLMAGYPVLRLNLRGAGPSRDLCRFQYHSGRSEDLRAVLEQLPAALMADGVVLIGWSLGGNMLLKALAEFGGAFPIRAAAVVSAPIDLMASARRFGDARNALYQRWLLARMREEATAGRAEISVEERAAIAKARDVIAFDDVFTAPRNGFRDAVDYYACNSAIGFMADIAVPTLVIHALDDPWIPARAYRAFEWDATPSLTPLLPHYGGHVGFHGPGGRSWTDDCMLTYFESR